MLLRSVPHTHINKLTNHISQIYYEIYEDQQQSTPKTETKTRPQGSNGTLRIVELVHRANPTRNQTKQTNTYIYYIHMDNYILYIDTRLALNRIYV